MGENTYANVTEMLQATLDDTSLVDETRDAIERRNIINKLVSLRCKRGLSQDEIAQRMNCSQSHISKIESREDAFLRIGDLSGYLDALGVKSLKLFLVEGDETIVDEVKFHASRIHSLLSRLADLAQNDTLLAKGISSFLGESFFNLLGIMYDCHRKLPTDDRSFHVEIHDCNISEVQENMEGVAT